MPIDVQNLREKYIAVIKASGDRSGIVSSDKNISNWSSEDIEAWAACLRDTHSGFALKPEFQPELLAVLMRANEIVTGHKLRHVQLFAILQLLDAKDKGLMEEVATGEGKTTIIAIFAVIKALQGNKVDVVTSSPVLAEHAAADKQKFYDLFGLTAACNWDERDKKLKPGSKACYHADIVYGDASSFEWDILKQEYEEENTRGKRPFNTVIVDEVDNLLIDDAANSAQLAGYKPAFEFFEPLLVACWQELIRLDQGFSIKSGKLYWQADPDSEPNEIPNQQEFIVAALTDYLTLLINSTEDKSVYIPKHLKSFVLQQVNTWVQSAILAHYEYTLGKHYTISANEHSSRAIVPVDYVNTGLAHTNSTWPDGLQQFLQIKEGLKVSAESLVSCYISNMTYFKRYGCQIYGVSGTLGATAEQKLLSGIYDIDFVKIPTFKQKVFEEYTGVIAGDSEKWCDEVYKNVQSETQKGRGVLVICESTNAAKALSEHLIRSGINASEVKHYTKVEESGVVDYEVKPSEIIIATNIAGRGTDIKTHPDVDSAGGLHVCVTFLPRNLRVEQQAFGRTSRQGKPGSGQLIINHDEVYSAFKSQGIMHPELGSIAAVKAQRDAIESTRLQSLKEHEVARIALRDELFSKFSVLCRRLGSKKSTKDIYKLKQLEEMWSIWLHQITKEEMQPGRDINSRVVMASFATFEQQAEEMFTKEDISNPCYLICSGNDSAFVKQQSSAVEKYTKAIELDPILAVHAYYNRARSIVEQKGASYKERAVADLKEARKIIADILIPQIHSLPVLASFAHQGTQGEDSDFNKQAETKAAVYKTQLQHIDAVIDVIENSTRDLKVQGYQSISTALSDPENYNSELALFNASGLEHFYQVVEEPPPPKKKGSFLGAIGCMFLGICQVVVGVVCCATGNIYLGKVLIKEGVNDVMYGIRKGLDGSFTWKGYKEHKVISLAITLATTGIEHIKARAAAAREAAKTTSQQTIRATTDAVSLEQIRDDNLTRAKQFVVKTVIHSGVREIAGFAVDRAIDAGIKLHKDEIEALVRKKIVVSLGKPDVKSALNKIIVANKISHINKIIYDLLTTKKTNFDKVADVVKSVMSGQHAVLTATVRLMAVKSALSECEDLLNDFGSELSSRILDFAGDLPDLPLDEDIGSLDSLDSSRELLCNTVIDIITRVIMGHVHGGIVMPVLDHVAEPYVQKVAAQAEQYFLSQPRSNSWSRFTTRSVAGFAAGDEPETNSVVKTKSRESMSSLADDTSLGHSSWLVAKHAGNDSVEVVSYDEAYHDYYSADFYTPEQPGVFSYVQAAGEGIYNGFVNTYDSVNYVLHNPVGVVENTAVLLWDSANAVSDVLFDISTISSRQRNAVRLWSACNTVDQFLNAQSVDRVRMVSEFGTSVATGTFTYRLAWSGATSVTRRGVALNYYMKNGYSVERALDHMRGIDFSSSVQVVTIPSGSQMTQYVKSGSRLGSYFTRPMTHPDSLGIFTGVRHPIRMVATSEAQALRTKAKAFKDTHTVPGITIDCNGGGVQYFIPDPKKSFK